MIRNQAMQQLLQRVFEKMHRLVFHTPPSAEMLTFINNVGVFSLGAFFSGVFLFIFNLLAGRLLGPELYGQYQVTLSYGGLFTIPMTIGINLALVRYVSPENDPAKQRTLFSTAATVVAILTICISGFLLVATKQIAGLLNISHITYILSISVAAVSAFLSIPKGMVYSLHKFRLGSFIELLTGLLSLGIFLLLYIALHRKTNLPIITHIIAISTLTIILLVYLRGFLSRTISRPTIKLFFQYGIFSTMNVVILFLLGNIDRLMLNWYLDLQTVGVYAAYMSAATFGSSAFLQIFNTVFFPTMSRQTEKMAILDKMYILVKKFGWIVFLISLVSIPVILKLFGSEYPFDALKTALIALSITCSIGWQIFSVFLSSEGIQGARMTTILSIIAAIALITLNAILIPRIGVFGAIISVLTSNILLLILCMRKARQYAFTKSALV